jgi:NAD(P)-dependent dehydrogenase (short-subunit alcohol dehydrogenase family)
LRWRCGNFSPAKTTNPVGPRSANDELGSHRDGRQPVGTINAAIVALAKAFSDRGITDGVQVNSVLPGPVMTGRRRSYLEHWASIHGMTAQEATEKFPRDAGIARYGEPEEIAELIAFLVSPSARWMTGSALRMDGGEVKSI